MEDEQFKFRNDFVRIPTRKFGEICMQNVVPKMSGTPGEVRWAGEEIGKFNREIFCGQLWLSEEELEKLSSEGVI